MLYLFNFHAERLMRNAGLEETGEGIRIAGRTLNNLRYADDTTLMAGETKDLESITRRVNGKARRLICISTLNIGKS